VVGSTVTVIGYGVTQEGGDVSDNLLEVDVQVVSHSTCNSQYGGGIFDETMICAGVSGGGKEYVAERVLCQYLLP
jgi:trypsin